MVDDATEHGDPWGLDEEIEQTEYMAKLWQRQAQAAQGTSSFELIRSVAAGYQLQLNALVATRNANGGRARVQSPLNQ